MRATSMIPLLTGSGMWQFTVPAYLFVGGILIKPYHVILSYLNALLTIVIVTYYENRQSLCIKIAYYDLCLQKTAENT
jgi:hypothetical protein